MLTLQEISTKNHELVRKLTVRPDQEKYVASIDKTLADAFVWRNARFRVAYKGDEAVGFVLVYPFKESGANIVNIVRLMIDARHQGRGLGRETLGATLAWIRTFRPDVDKVQISTHPENSVALHLYRRMGFQKVGIVNGEQVLSLARPMRE